jgi:hypothetical protein
MVALAAPRRVATPILLVVLELLAGAVALVVTVLVAARAVIGRFLSTAVLRVAVAAVVVLMLVV